MHDSISGGDRIRTVHSWRLNLVLLDSFPDSQVWRSPLRAGIGRKRASDTCGRGHNCTAWKTAKRDDVI